MVGRAKTIGGGTSDGNVPPGNDGPLEKFLKVAQTVRVKRRIVEKEKGAFGGTFTFL